MRNSIKKIIAQFSRIFTWSIQGEIKAIREFVRDGHKLRIDEYLRENLYEHPKYMDPKKLGQYEYQVYSQNGEDGIVQEIFKRIGTTNKFFFEFGVENGIQCNTLSLLLQGWRGCWLDGNPAYIHDAKEKFAQSIVNKKLDIKEAFVTAGNIEELLSSANTPKDLDLLSIDIDGNDYWIWKAITKYSPRVVIIEYNPIFRPPIEFSVRYESERKYNGFSHFGASLKSLEILGIKKGYRLVACNFHGVNAFFVRGDLVRDKFLAPYTAENHYEPSRHFAITTFGHKRDFGAFETPR